jgi:putative ABC transport system substrate-binding protein
MRRREFIVGIGTTAAWPLAARAQQGDRVRRIGVLMAAGENDPEGKSQLFGLMQGLADLGWTDGSTMRMDVRWAAGDVDLMRKFAKELVNLGPDVIISGTTAGTAALQRETRTIPIIFAAVTDPVGSGFVASLPRPGGNITGFAFIEASMAGKYLELLTEIAPGVSHAALMFNPDTISGGGSHYLAVFEAAARSLKVTPIIAPVRSDAEIETAMVSLGREPGGGLVVSTDPFMFDHRAPTILAAAQNNLPAVYWNDVFIRDGGLLSYAPDVRDGYRRSASYVDRILRGAKPAEIPVQLPVKFKMVINLKTAKALGLTIPETLLATADEVIQ